MMWLLVAHALAADCTVLWSADGSGVVALPEGRAAGLAIVIEGDRIAAVGTPHDIGISAVGGAPMWGERACDGVDIAQKTVTPGFVAISTRLGVTEVSLEAATNDFAGEDDRVRAALRVADAYDPRSTLIPVARLGGVTSSVVAPEGGVVAGQAAWVDLSGPTQADQVIAGSVAMVAGVGGESRAEGLLRLREVLDDARLFGRNPRAFDDNRVRPLAASRLDLEALQPVVRGELPLLVVADRAADLEAIARFADEQRVRVVVSGAAEGWLVADRLAEAGIAVVIDPLVYGPGSFDQVYARADNAALLVEAGVDVMLAPYSSHNARLVGQVAGNAVRGGMGWDDALAAVTATPARVFGQADRGVLRPGAVANLVVWGALDRAGEVDPFELTSTVDGVWIGGVAVDLRSRQTELFERYRTLPGTPLPALDLP